MVIFELRANSLERSAHIRTRTVSHGLKLKKELVVVVVVVVVVSFISAPSK